MATLKLINGYPESMRESIKKVEETRAGRIGKLPEPMSLDARKDILDLCHPDFAEGGKREVKVGVSKGILATNEVADLLEAYPLVDKEDVDLSKVDYEVDLLVIGGGMAGTGACILANDNGIPANKMLLVSKLRHGDSNSIMAQGGTQAADRPEDSPTRHFMDALGGGHFTNKKDVLKALCEDGPIAMKWMGELGVLLDREPDNTFTELLGGGTSRRRMHAAKDYTGLEELRAMKDEFLSREIPSLEFYPVVELLSDGKKVTGALLWGLETHEYKVVRAKATVLATGGFGRLHIRGFPTSNHYGATGDGLALAYRIGAKLLDTDTVQYHPTGAAYPQQLIGQLITEIGNAYIGKGYNEFKDLTIDDMSNIKTNVGLSENGIFESSTTKVDITGVTYYCDGEALMKVVANLDGSDYNLTVQDQSPVKPAALKAAIKLRKIHQISVAGTKLYRL